MSTAWVAEQLLLIPRQAARPPAFNPRPAGRPVGGSATDDVLHWLLERPSRQAWWSMHQIIRGTGRSGKACCWAVIYLHRIGVIDRARDVAHSRYFRYRANTKADQ